MKTLIAAIALSFIAGASLATAMMIEPAALVASQVGVQPAAIEKLQIIPAATLDAGRCFETVGGELRCH